MKNVVVAPLAVLAALLASCGGHGTQQTPCVPTAVSACTCGTDTVGTQQCEADGSGYGACRCESACQTGASCACGDGGNDGELACGGDGGEPACICPEPAACSASSLTASGTISTSGGTIDYTGTAVTATFTNALNPAAPQTGCLTGASLGFAIEEGACSLTLQFADVANGSGGLTGATLNVDSGCGALTGVPQGVYTTPTGYGLVALQSSPAIPNAVSPQSCVMGDTVSFGANEIPLSDGSGGSITLSLGNLTLTGSLFSTGAAGACYATSLCAMDYTESANGWCAPTACPPDDHEGGNGECVTDGTCVSGYTLNGSGDCVSSASSCATPPQASAGGDQSVVTGTTVTVSGSGSTGAAPLHYAWAITSKPSGSTAALSSATAETVTFVPDMAGSYAIELVVTDVNGCQSAPVSASISAGSAANKVRLSLRVTWNAGFGDVDLHYLEPDGTLFTTGSSASDSWAYEPNPDWGPNGPDGNVEDDPDFGAGQPAGQPADEQWGGSVGESNEHPPTGVQPDLFDAVFTPVVHYYCSREIPGVSASSGPVTATIHVSVNGTEVYTASQILNQRDAWPAAAITVSQSGTQASVAASGQPVQSIPVDMYTDGPEDLGGCTSNTN